MKIPQDSCCQTDCRYSTKLKPFSTDIIQCSRKKNPQALHWRQLFVSVKLLSMIKKRLKNFPDAFLILPTSINWYFIDFGKTQLKSL